MPSPSSRSRTSSLLRFTENIFTRECVIIPLDINSMMEQSAQNSQKVLYRSSSSTCSIDDDEVEQEVREGTMMGISTGLVGEDQDESDVDTREASPLAGPLHLLDPPSLAHTVFRSKKNLNSSADSVSTVETSGSSTPRLTLSAFRRPEHTIRLTNANISRKLESEYDLHASECGVLGHGAFSTVRLAIRRCDNVKVAVKSIAKHEALRSRRLQVGGGKSYMEEWEILRRFRDHPHIITLLDVFESDEDVQLVMEYCPGGELFDAIQKKRNRAQCMRRGQYSESHAAIITNQILHALVDLHAQGIVHRDVKPENILLVGDYDDTTNIHVKLCDFGVARSLLRVDGDVSPLNIKRARSFSILGSDYYVAPEVCMGYSYDTAIDIYSLGVTLHILLCGFPPVFSGPDSDQVIFPNMYWKDISPDAIDLVKNMLASDVQQRISARTALGHPWIVRKAILSKYFYAPSNRPLMNHEEKPLDFELVHRRLFQYQQLEQDRERDESLEAAAAAVVAVVASTSSSSKRKRLITSESPLRGSSKTDSGIVVAAAATTTITTRRRFDRAASTTLMALTDLYRSVSPSRSRSSIMGGIGIGSSFGGVVGTGVINASTATSTTLPIDTLATASVAVTHHHQEQQQQQHSHPHHRIVTAAVPAT